ncbi:hypothetical protein PYW07_015910 [Mythimna separata]|uniref:Uncharacterized protein n=1 Tax=Mythimna separata TaxID=271217 RepID=A0AAD7YRB5_MYTSE|nr:hypothetical protein PYW07_015910 [Mythimna separata]
MSVGICCSGMSWCVEALRGYSGGAAGARLELGGALAALRALRPPAAAPAQRALQRLKAVARAHPHDRVLRAEANTDAAFVAYALGNWTEARQLSEAASRDDPYSCCARVTSALAGARATGGALAWRAAADQLAAATHLDPADLIAAHDLALALEQSGDEAAMGGAMARWSLVRNASGAGATLRALAAAGLARRHQDKHDAAAADHWYSLIGNWDAGVTCALAHLHSEMGDTQTAKHHYQDVEAVWPCELSALEWLAGEAQPDVALQYYRRAARLQPTNPQWGLLMGACLRASGRYQEALSLYKKMNARFPDNVQCLKLIVKLCGDQGLSETTSWTRELQRAQARVKQKEQQVSVTSAGSVSSGASQSPIDQLRGGGRVDSAAGAPERRASDARADSGHARPYAYSSSPNQEGLQPVSRPINRSETRKKHIDEFDDDLPLPPE